MDVNIWQMLIPIVLMTRCSAVRCGNDQFNLLYQRILESRIGFIMCLIFSFNRRRDCRFEYCGRKLPTLYPFSMLKVPSI